MPRKIKVEFTLEELYSIIGFMEFIEGGVSGKDENERMEFEFKFRRALADLLENKIIEKSRMKYISDDWVIIHPLIKKVAKKRFEDGHYADSVESAYKEINKQVKEIVKRVTGKEFDGTELMEFAFSPNNPIIKLGDINTISGKNIQRGYMELFKGSITAIRNPIAHENKEIDYISAFHLIIMASHLIRIINI